MYTITRKIIRTGFLKFKISYGIRINKRRVDDLSLDKKKVAHLCALFNRYGLAETHLDDVLQDFLCTLKLEQ